MFALNQGGQCLGCAAQSMGKLALPECRHQLFVDDAFGQQVWDGAFQGARDFDANAPILQGDHEQHPIADVTPPKFPLVGNTPGVSGNVLGCGCGHQEHDDLCAKFALSAGELRRELLLFTCGQDACLVDDTCS